jgi:hypothetical protein
MFKIVRQTEQGSEDTGREFCGEVTAHEVKVHLCRMNDKYGLGAITYTVEEVKSKALADAEVTMLTAGY